MTILSKLKEKAAELPQLPGVYLMKDEQGGVIYVGKAVRLRNRVSSYFRNESADLSEHIKTDAMISQVADFEVVVVESEFEALLLENSLIKELLPKYNIKLRDDKGYPVIRADMGSEYPRFKIVSNPSDDGELYLGPYGGRTDTAKALAEVRRAFKLPSCGKNIKNIIGKQRPCLNYDMGNCLGYCADAGLRDAHRSAFNAAVDVFQGKTGRLTKALTAEMSSASDSLNFELAAILRDRIKAIKRLEERQFFKESPIAVDEAAYKEKTLKTHLWLEKALGLDKTPERIEAFDISNIGSSDIVGSMVVFVRGKPLKKDYRRFRIKSKKKQDDYGCMAEVVSRRVKRFLANDERFAVLPDVMLIDGGVSHALTVKRVLDGFGLAVPIFGMVKDDKHRTRALVSPLGDEIGLSGSPAVFALVGSIQEEAHRFAVEYHRKLRSNSMLG